MKIQSLMKQGLNWVPLEVEISLAKGVPSVEFLGLPDALAKESIKRIKTAFETCGWPWPKSQRMTINLRPHHIKKSSQGLDLPIAVALIKASGQVPEWPFSEGSYYYGELDLAGNVHQPDDLRTFVPLKKSMNLVTGVGKQTLYCESQQIKNLLELQAPVIKPSQNALELLEPPNIESDFQFSEEMAELLLVLAAGEHSALLSGPAGSGKTTIAHVLRLLQRPPKEDRFRMIRKIHLQFGDEIKWRPFVSPHHSIPVIAMIGGNVPITPGELTRAHGGILLLDELLEFSPLVQEALREPMESGVVKVARRGVQNALPAEFQLIATTNLCPCGKYAPNSYVSCRFSLRKCRSYLERLSGPILDRFDILTFSNKWSKKRTVTIEELKEKLKPVFEFQKFRSQTNSRLEICDIQPLLSQDVQLIGYVGEDQSLRRKRAVLRVARTFADLEGSETIQLAHMVKATALAVRPFQELEMLD